MIFSEEKITTLKKEIEPLLKEHWDKAVTNKSYNLKPNWIGYCHLQNTGAIKVFTARVRGLLVGYASVYIAKSLYAEDRLEAHYDMIYITPEYRQGASGAKFIKYIEKNLEVVGVKQIGIASLAHQPFDKLLDRLDYKHTEKVYTKCIG